MKYIRITNENIKDNFLAKLLDERGILTNGMTELERKAFLNPSEKNELDPFLLDHMAQAVEMFINHINNKSKIRIYVDPDVDGFTSAALLYNYMREVLEAVYGEIDITYHIPDGKEHGLKTVMNELTNEKICDLIIMPDSSSNDYEEHKLLSEMGYDILVLDHHEADHYSEHAVIVNNQLSENYDNKALSGVGVVYKFLEALEMTHLNFNVPPSRNYIDLVALGQISDMMDMNTMENRYICRKGLTTINNPFFNELVMKQSFSIGDKLTQVGVAFYITPLINALIRVGGDLEKERLFEAFIDPYRKVPSTKRGEKGKEECICIQSARNCTNAKNKQNRDKEKAIELLDIQVIENCLDENKILILNADDLDVSNTLTGLCAMGMAANHKKPVMLGRISPDGYLKGSIRGRDGSELKDFKAFLMSSGLMEYVEGHANAAGFSIKENNIEKLTEYANKELANMNFNEGFYEADFVVNGNSTYLRDLILDIDDGKELWGQGNKEPVVIIENITVGPRDIQFIGANKDTIKIQFNGIEYMRFKATELKNQLSQIDSKVNLTIAGRCNVNRYMGSEKPQIVIDEIEFKPVSHDDF